MIDQLKWFNFRPIGEYRLQVGSLADDGCRVVSIAADLRGVHRAVENVQIPLYLTNRFPASRRRRIHLVYDKG